MLERSVKISEEEAKRKVNRDWDQIEERAANNIGGSVTLERLKSEHPDWPEFWDPLVKGSSVLARLRRDHPDWPELR